MSIKICKYCEGTGKLGFQQEGCCYCDGKGFVDTKGKLYTSYFAKFKKGIGDKISIARYNPKWLNRDDLFAWCSSLAPSTILLNDYKYKGLSWDEYTERYYTEIKNSEKAQADISSICVNLINGNDVTLYCYEKSTDNCHRHLLAEIFKEKGFEVEEIK